MIMSNRNRYDRLKKKDFVISKQIHDSEVSESFPPQRKKMPLYARFKKMLKLFYQQIMSCMSECSKSNPFFHHLFNSCSGPE